MKKQRLAVFASGTGSNFEAMMREDDLASDIRLLISDVKDAPVLRKAKELGVETSVFLREDYESNVLFEQAMMQKLRSLAIDWIFLAGYMRLLGPTLIKAYPEKIVNIHPSLLPEFPGLDAIKQAIDAGALKTGVTIHFVDEGMDTGQVIAQEEIIIHEKDTYETVKQNVQQIEHQLYPTVIRQLIK